MRKFIAFLIVAALLVLTATAVYAAPPPEGPPGLEQAIAVQEAHNPRLLATPGVVGTAVGMTPDGKAAVKVFTEKVGTRLPDSLDGVPVVVEVTGKFTALQLTTDWSRPAPTGVSTGNAKSNSAGTIACRVKDAKGNVYALSNTHVYAPYAIDSQKALRDRIVQPGVLDILRLPEDSTDPRYNDPTNPKYTLGTLARYVRINGSVFATNEVDAAIAKTTTGLLGQGTPEGGYGIPSRTTTAASVGLAVQKFGRTTLLTKGNISAINATVIVEYYSGWYAWFVRQIIVNSSTAFIKGGDSGSLLVTDNVSSNPVGLLFAGNGDGTMAIANRIDRVLSKLGVTVDGK